MGDNVKTVQKSVDQDNKLNHSGVTAETKLSTSSKANWYKTSWDNTTDNSKRLKVIIDGIFNGGGQNPEDASQTITWVNVTTEIHPSQIVDMEGTALMSYDVTTLICLNYAKTQLKSALYCDD